MCCDTASSSELSALHSREVSVLCSEVFYSLLTLNNGAHTVLPRPKRYIRLLFGSIFFGSVDFCMRIEGTEKRLLRASRLVGRKCSVELTGSSKRLPFKVTSPVCASTENAVRKSFSFGL